MKTSKIALQNTGSKRLTSKTAKKLAKASRDFRKSGKRNMFASSEDNSNTRNYS